MEFPDDLRFTEDHEWLRVEDGIGTVGISDFAQHELTDIVFVELPEVGTDVEQGAPFGAVEAIKAVSELYAPADGTIVEVNSDLEAHPEWVNEDPYGAGWMVRIRMTDMSQAGGLMSADDYRAMVE